MERVIVPELLGDGISAELSESVHAVAKALPFPVAFEPVDLSWERREHGFKEAYDEAEAKIRAHGIGLKYPTATVRESPNAQLRERLHFSVIHRPVRTLPGVATRHSGKVDLHIVRIATGGTYDDAGRRIGKDVAVSVRVIERKPCHEAALFAFRLARRLGTGVISTSKYTIQRMTDGLFEEEVKVVATKFPGVAHRCELFDALLAHLFMRPEDFQVIVTPNEYGDFLSDAACGMIGSMGLGASASYSFSSEGDALVGMFDPAGGTAPDIAGKGIANPTAALLAFAMLLEHAGHAETGRALEAAIHGAIEAGEKTRDLGGSLSTSDFTAAVASRLKLP